FGAAALFPPGTENAMTDQIPPARRLRRSATALGSQVADSYIVMDIEAGRYFSFNETGSAIWRALEEPVSEDEIVASLCDGFDIDPEQCRARIAPFLDHLLQCGIAESAPVQASP